MPRIRETRAEGDGDARRDALRRLCPCRARRYDREVWLAIFRAYGEAEEDGIRDQAQHAIETLRQRVRADPRSQELVRWLAEQEGIEMELETAIPVWNPRPRGAPPVPRWERPRR